MWLIRSNKYFNFVPYIFFGPCFLREKEVKDTKFVLVFPVSFIRRREKIQSVLLYFNC